MLHTNSQEWVERGRALVGAPPLSRGDKAKRGLEDPKWAIGDLLLEVPESLIQPFATELGQDTQAFRLYRAVAAAWPVGSRVAASWTAHRELMHDHTRFEIIKPGMTMREARVVAGKKRIDAKPLERLPAEERATQALALLLDKAVNEKVLEELSVRRERRRVERAARLASDERSAQYKDAMRELREAQVAKSPELAFIEVVFQISKYSEYVRAVRAAAEATDVAVPLVPDHRKPDLIFALEGLRNSANDALEALDPRSGSLEVIDVTARERSRIVELLESTPGARSDQ
jgi:hypothetical protein